jgi:hypothetical protein
MKIKMIISPLAAIFAAMFVTVFLGACKDFYYVDGKSVEFSGKGIGYSNNGMLEGTVWVKEDSSMVFSKNAATFHNVYREKDGLGYYSNATLYSYYDDEWGHYILLRRDILYMNIKINIILEKQTQELIMKLFMF